MTKRKGCPFFISMIGALLCLLSLAGCTLGNSDLSKMGDPLQTCFSDKGPVPGPVMFHATTGQSGLYVAGGAGIYRFSATGGHLKPIWLYRMHNCIVLTPTPGSGGPGPTFELPLIHDGPTVANTMVFFSVDEGSGSWVDLYALHATDGSLAWRQRITDVSRIGGLLVSHDLIYIETGASTDSSDYIIRAINVRDGSLRWSYRYQTDFSDSSQGLNDVGNGGLYVTTSHTLYALNATTGTKLWQRNISSDQKFSGVLLFDRTVYATSSSGCFNCEVQPDSSAVYAFNASTGKQVWQSQRVAGFLTYPTEANGIVYAGSQDGHLYAFRAANGTVRWRSYTGGELHVQPQVTDGLVFVGTAIFLDKDDPNSTPTHLLALNAINGHQIWSYTFPPTKYDGYTPIFVGNGQLFTISIDDNVDIHVIAILQARTGKQVLQQSIMISGYSSSLLSMAFAP